MSAMLRCKAKQVVLEGPIAAGQSAALAHISKDERFNVIPEPVNIWQGYEEGVGVVDPYGLKLNMLALYYANMKRYAFGFQNFVMWSFMHVLRGGLRTDKINVCERSVQSSVHVFSELLFGDQILMDFEMGILKANAKIFLDGFEKPVLIFLSAPPEICFERIKQRARTEEASIPLSYVQRLGAAYSRWLTGEAPKQFSDIYIVDATGTPDEVLKLVEDIMCKL